MKGLALAATILSTFTGYLPQIRAIQALAEQASVVLFKRGRCLLASDPVEVDPTDIGTIMSDHRTMPSSEKSTATPPAPVASLDRRRAMLKGLGKGGTLLAAAAPMTSFAVGRVRTTDGKQCTVSGQMSAVMSSAASANPCAAYHPTHFFAASVPKAVASWGGMGTAGDDLRTALTSLAVGGYYLRGTAAVFYKQVDGNVRKLTAINRPSTGSASAALKVSEVLTGYFPSDQTVIALLHGSSTSAAAFFIAAYFSAGVSTVPSGAEKVPFLAADVLSHWGAGTQASAEQLYRLVCTVGEDASKLG